MSKKLTSEYFTKKLNDIYGNQFVLLSEYINNETKVKLLCTKCNSIIYKRPSKMVTSTHEGCYVCSGKNRHKTKESFQKEVDSKYPDTYLIIGDYVNARIPLTVKRLKCGHIYDVSPDNLLRGKGCPKCTIKQSHYMDIVENYLNLHGIEFEKEKRFDDCKHIRVLPFDYYIPKLNMCIEVDGEFHFPNNSVYAKDKRSYQEVNKRDNIKNQYCEDNKIALLRLPYTKEKDFEKILDKYIC